MREGEAERHSAFVFLGGDLKLNVAVLEVVHEQLDAAADISAAAADGAVPRGTPSAGPEV